MGMGCTSKTLLIPVGAKKKEKKKVEAKFILEF